jgi:predicted dehydrogenase
LSIALCHSFVICHSPFVIFVSVVHFLEIFMTPLKVAVIGAGHLGRIHARLLAQMPGLELVGIVDPLAAARDEVAAACQTRAFEHHRQLAGQIDAAVVAAPTRHHHAVAMDLVDQGLHLLVEKPIAATAQQADELVQAARRRGVVLQVGHVERFNPVMRLVEPHLMAPLFLDAVRCGSYTFRSTDIGVVLDLMIHDIDLALAMVGRPVRRVEAVGFSMLGGHEDMASARIEFDGGCVATLSASRVSYQAERRMQVFSARGFVTVDFAARTATLLGVSATVRRHGIDVDSLTSAEIARLKERLFDEVLPLERMTAPEGNALADELADFADSIRTGRQPRVTGEAGAAALAVAEQVLSAIATHRSQAGDGQSIIPMFPPPAWQHEQRRSAS